MNKLKSWGAPLVIFVIGEICFLFLFLCAQSLDNAAATLANDTLNVTSIFWGWAWVMTPGVVRSIVFTAYQLGLMILIGYIFLKSKD